MKKVTQYLTIMAFALFFWQCESLEELTETPLMRSLDDIQHEWTVDSIRYTRYELDGTILSDVVRPVGKMTFNELSEVETKDLLFNHGYVIHKYQDNSMAKTDTTAWSYGVDADIKVKYLNLFYKDVSDNTFTAGKTIYDIRELSNTSFYLYRFEMLVDPINGNTYGKARSIIKMHR